MKKKLNSKFKIENFEYGYTLVELLAVIIVMVVVSMVIAGILVSSFRNSSKSNVVDNVTQNGNNAIVQMSKMITYARNFNGVSTGSAQLYTTDCTRALPPSVSYKFIKITAFDNGMTIFGCNGASDNPANTITSNSASLINTSSVSVLSCNFTCTQNGYGQVPTIGIYFTLSQIGSGGFAEKSSTIPFETSVTMRNVAF